MILPNRIRIKAPQLLLSTISIQEAKAEYIKTVVLREPIPGIDGCIGLSFLNRFNYRIEKGEVPHLSLIPKIIMRETFDYDVFISYKDEDSHFAQKVFDFLIRSGYKPFFAKVTLREITDTSFQKAIDHALESSKHLIIVGSTRQNIESPWVEGEWRAFINLKNSGQNKGNVIPVLCKEMTVNDLPIALRRYQAIHLDEPDWESTLIRFLPQE